MGKRRTGRKLAMQVLYQIDSQNGNIDFILDHHIEMSDYQPQTKELASQLARMAWNHVADSDQKIKEYAIDWEFERIAPVDKALLRLAFYELMKTDVSKSIIIDEVIELAKQYSSQESPKFINGILGAYVEKECLQG
jgi:N utilization substance protein B